MRAVDTNVLVRLVIRDDPAQVRAAEHFIVGGAWVSQLVLAETVWVLEAVYERTAQQIGTALDMLLNHKELSLQDAEVVTAAVEHFRKRPSLGFSDCLLIEIARKAGHLPLGTFDRDLATVDGVQRLNR
ncbi:MAG TPA: type II toxin-antitoxin system VapC family toxin [Steroidobacteraceae bacterium]|jgi:predicted nucleic-acid-binding protein|nr:type II toxin-antitoxin system VapC family toxin [Steroidobacteraceae bacterium]